MFYVCYLCGMVQAAERSTDAAREAWRSFWRIFMEDKRRRWAILSELGISPQQAMALGTLEPDKPLSMSALAESLHCDNSNITGIVDRLEAAGLAERRPHERDRRVKAVVLTEEGQRMRVEIERRAGEPPPRLRSLSEEDAIALRDILARALADR
jgi:DNA-binding MarR family transcriptional regulator